MKTIYFALTLITSVALFSCVKPGPGGAATINVHVIDDNANSPYSLVKIKYGGTGFPGAGASYDETDTCDHTGKNSFRNLKRGSYYVYAEWSDSAGTIKQGGAKVKIGNRIGEQHIVIDFSEADPF